MNRTPTTLSWIFVASLLVAVFLLGMIAALVLQRAGRASALKTVQAYLSLFFTLVAVLVTVDVAALTYEFNHYVHSALGRDSAQEECQRATLKSLRAWALARKDVYDAEHARDQTLAVLFAQIAQGEYAHPDTAVDVQQKFDDVEASRQRAEKSLQDNPIPDCKLAPND